MSSAYDFNGSASHFDAELRTLGKSLQQPGLPKDSLVKLLKQSGGILEQAPQSEPSRQAATDICQALVQKPILHHRDKGVKVFAAYCLSNIVRLYAGEDDLPFELQQQQDIFVLFMWTFRQLENSTSPLFTRCLSVLELVTQVKCCVLMLDWEDEDIVCDLFQVLCEAINDKNKEQIQSHAIEVMATVLEEPWQIPQQLWDALLNHLLPPASDDRPEAFELVRQLLRRVERDVQPQLQLFLTNILDGKVDSDLEDDYPLLIYQVLLPVLPRLGSELHVDSDDKRTAAVNLLGRLFTVPGSDMASQHPQLFDALLLRCKDQKPAVRIAALHVCADLLLSLPSAACRQQVLDAVCERLLDYDDKVRAAASASICKAAAADLQCVTQQALEAVSVRVRDTKLAVRKEAAGQLLNVFRAHCGAARGGEISSAEDAIMWVPGRVLKDATDPDMSQHMADTLLRPGLLPPKLPARDMACHWTAVYMAASQQERAALMDRLAVRERLQAHVGQLLELRAAKDAAKEPELAATILRIARSFADASRAHEQLRKLQEMRDNNIFKDLGQLLSSSLELPAAASLTKTLVQRIGSRGATADFVRSLCVQLSPTLLPSSCVAALLELAAQPQTATSDAAFHAAVLQLLVASAQAAPSLFSDTADQIIAMLDSDDAELAQAAPQILAAAGGVLARQDASKDHDLGRLAPALMKLMTQGPYKVTKAAVRALVKSLPAEDVRQVLQPLCKKLTGGLGRESLTQANLSAVIQTLSSIGQLQPDIFAPHAPAFASFILHTLLPADPSSLARSKQSKHKGMPAGEAALLKAYAIKALARACTPSATAQPPSLQQPLLEAVDGAVEELGRLLEAEDMQEAGCSDAGDASILRLATASALLRLCRLHDARVPPDTFMMLSLSMQDQSRTVRNSFAYKVHRTMYAFEQGQHSNQKAAKYAAMLALAGADPNMQNQQAAFSYLRGFVTSRRRTNQTAAAVKAASTEEAGGTTLHEFPDFLIPFLVQILAHHTDFPTEEEAEASPQEVYQPFVRMLQFAFEALLLPSASSNSAPGATLPAMVKILQYLKRTEDATPVPATPYIHTVCDLALALAPAVLQAYAPGAEAGGNFPGTVPLPSAFYRRADHASATGRGSTLPEGFAVELGEPAFHELGRPAGAGKKRLSGDKHGKPSTRPPGRAAGGKDKADTASLPSAVPSQARSTQPGASRRTAQKRTSKDSPGSSGRVPTDLIAPPEDDTQPDASPATAKAGTRGDASPGNASPTPSKPSRPPRARRSKQVDYAEPSDESQLDPHSPHTDDDADHASIPEPGLSDSPSHTQSPDENTPADINKAGKRPGKQAQPYSPKRKRMADPDPNQCLKHSSKQLAEPAGKPSKPAKVGEQKRKALTSRRGTSDLESAGAEGGPGTKAGKASSMRSPSVPARAQPRRGAKDVAVANLCTSGKSRGSNSSIASPHGLTAHSSAEKPRAST